MRILFLVRSLGLGGTERQLIVLAKALAARGHTVAVALFYARGPLEAELSDSDIPVHILEKKGRWDLWGPLRRLVTLIKRDRPDIVQAYLPTANILAAATRLFVREPKLVFGVRASDMEVGGYGFVSDLTYRLEAWLARYADLVISNSKAGLRSAWARGMPAGRGLVIPNGIDMERFRPDLKAAKRSGTYRIGMIARLDPMKDYDTFLDAARIIAAKRKDVHFVLAGEGTEALARKTDELNVEIAGGLAQPEALIASLDIAIMSSRFGEGFPNAIAEAMASGVPVVATDIGDAVAIVGSTGKIVPPGDAAALAEAVLDLIPLARNQELRAACRRHIEENFSVQSLAEETEAALVSLLECHSMRSNDRRDPCARLP